jgi:hypothetical protein
MLHAEKFHNAFINKKPNTVKPVLRGHLWDKEKVALKDR